MEGMVDCVRAGVGLPCRSKGKFRIDMGIFASKSVFILSKNAPETKKTDQSEQIVLKKQVTLSKIPL
jgi:hypothetical protein